MNLYSAMLLAADHIEQAPAAFCFSTNQIPEDCGTQGCALGWVAFFAGIGDIPDVIGNRSAVGRFAENVMQLPTVSLYGSTCNNPEMTFYRRMDAMESPGESWIDDPLLTAKLLRAYAEKYHGHEKQRPTSSLVADLMTRVMGEPIPEEA